MTWNKPSVSLTGQFASMSISDTIGGIGGNVGGSTGATIGGGTLVYIDEDCSVGANVGATVRDTEGCSIGGDSGEEVICIGWPVGRSDDGSVAGKVVAGTTGGGGISSGT